MPDGGLLERLSAADRLAPLGRSLGRFFRLARRREGAIVRIRQAWCGYVACSGCSCFAANTDENEDTAAVRPMKGKAIDSEGLAAAAVPVMERSSGREL